MGKTDVSSCLEHDQLLLDEVKISEVPAIKMFSFEATVKCVCFAGSHSGYRIKAKIMQSADGDEGLYE